MPHNRQTSLLVLTLLFGVLGFMSVDNGIPEDTVPISAYSAIDAPRLEIALRRGQLELDGHTASDTHETSLLQSANQLFPGARTRTNFKPMGMVPDYWAAASIDLLRALSVTRSASAVLTDGTVRIHGVSTQTWHEAAQDFRAALPESTVTDIQMIIADDSIRVRDLCQRAFAEYRTGAINFEESTTLLRSSAKLDLDRAISLADACPGSVVTITGHTDSSGPEAWNRQLSLDRANTVADYLEQGGIRRARMLTVGKGSSEPIASDFSRYGRGLNRRIEIEFRHDP
ncbi:MAG: OmpA family protein [Woeseiaceae bacterium]